MPPWALPGARPKTPERQPGSGGVFVVVMVSGFMTFGTVSESFILNNYAMHDGAAVLARFATGISLYTSYPLIFVRTLGPPSPAPPRPFL